MNTKQLLSIKFEIQNLELARELKKEQIKEGRKELYNLTLTIKKEYDALLKHIK